MKKERGVRFCPRTLWGSARVRDLVFPLDLTSTRSVEFEAQPSKELFSALVISLKTPVDQMKSTAFFSDGTAQRDGGLAFLDA